MARSFSSKSHHQNECCLSVNNLKFLINGPYTFEVKKGECVGLSGKSGVGKTQLLRAITDLIPHTGEVLLEGVSSTSFSAPLWRSRVTMIPAESFWWYDIVGDHFSAKGEMESLKKKLAAVGFVGDILTWQVSRLSTGERQRLALIRGLCNKPSVLLLDEPCSSLDGYHSTLVESFVLEYLQRNRAAVLWVSHDPEQLQRIADRELFLEQKKLTESRGYKSFEPADLSLGDNLIG